MLPPMRPLGVGNAKLPALPKHMPLQLPNQILTKVPAIQMHSKFSAPPPPPPPRIEEAIKRHEIPTPPAMSEASGKNGAPVWRTLQEFKGDPLTMISAQPRPPPKRPPASKVPQPPLGPPPAHAIILAKKGQAGVDESTIVAKARPLVHVPKPPSESIPSFIRKNFKTDSREGGDAVLARAADHQVQEALRAGEKPPWPVPDWIVWATHFLVQIFVGGVVVACCVVIIVFGTYLTPGAVWATHAATVVGCIVNVGVFESIKCIVVACVALVKDETLKRQAEITARKARMALKAQRIQNLGGKFRQPPQLPNLAPPPPFLG